MKNEKQLIKKTVNIKVLGYCWKVNRNERMGWLSMVIRINRNGVSEWPEFFGFGFKTSRFVKYEPVIIDRFLLFNFFPFWWVLILTNICLRIILFSLTLWMRTQYFFYIDISFFSRIQNFAISKRGEYFRIINVRNVPNDGLIDEFLDELLL